MSKELTEDEKNILRETNKNISSEDNEHLIDMSIRHFEEYKFFTRLLLSLSTGSIILLVSLKSVLEISGLIITPLYILSLLFLLVSSIFGVGLQQEILMRYIYSIERVFSKYNRNLGDKLQKKNAVLLEIDKIKKIPDSSKDERDYHKFQNLTFVIAIVFLVLLLIASVFC